ncbi:unnamed protein product [Ilex paraguariensis]|uniref:Cyclin N-terminal domain-containing protein n=1 Tax=Ilex paraguariensis TaxID=185542 RepID=A0ABC8UWF7_9AQUA
MGDSKTPFSSSPLCQEDIFRSKGHEDKDIDFNPCSISESDDEYMQQLSRKRPMLSQLALAFFGFHFRTIYLSLIYFDRFFSRCVIENGKIWSVRLISVACLSLSAKMEELKVQPLSEYHVDDHNFEDSTVKKMELMGLDALGWKMGPTLPFDYLHYFAIKFCDDSERKELISKATELIMALTKVINLLEHRPLIIAAAAVLAACEDQLTKASMELKISVITSWGSPEKLYLTVSHYIALRQQHIYSCYGLLRKMPVGKSNTGKSDISPNLSSTPPIRENSPITSGIGTSRRRLRYNTSDQHCPVSKELIDGTTESLLLTVDSYYKIG